jgi:hypothetical protein
MIYSPSLAIPAFSGLGGYSYYWPTGIDPRRAALANANLLIQTGYIETFCFCQQEFLIFVVALDIFGEYLKDE